jgi:uncharacterized protein
MDQYKILREARTIAVVGCSALPYRTSYRIASYLINAGYEVIPVNPHHEEVLGRRCYPTLNDIGKEVRIDIVNVFRRPAATEEMVGQMVTRAEETGERPVIWTQIGVSSQPAEALARAHGFPYIRNRCIMVEHARI